MTKPAHVLVVEDDMVIAIDLRDQLQSLGVETTSFASNAEEALQIAEEDAPQLAIIDMVLEDGKTGLKIGQILRKMYGTKVIFITGFRQPVSSYYMDGVAGVLQKPFAPSDLKELLLKTL